MKIKQDGITPNAGWLLWAGFMAILAAGVGFGIRGGILADWGAEFGFNATQLGNINGAGFTGFCFGIMIGGVIVDRIGYGWLVIAAFVFHVLSALVTFAAMPEQSADTAYNFLYWGTFIFAVANGTLEAVANPLVATLFPSNRTHYLNILHASWPAGLVLGGLVGWTLGEQFDWHWKYQLALFLVPTVIYGLMFLGQKMPKSEASQQGLSFGETYKEVGILGSLVVCFVLYLFFVNALTLNMYLSIGMALAILAVTSYLSGFSVGAWLIFVLFITHALVGAVELGTDGWIQNITGNILTPAQGKILFVFASFIMFSLRFGADFIEKRLGLSPIGILLVCAVLAAIGLNLVSVIDTFVGAMLALAVYAVGKTFFWPTMLAVVGDRFPKTGAVAMSIMGGIGMMSAGLIGSPGLGYAKDRFAGEELQTANAELYAEYKSEDSSQFLFFEEVYGLDGEKLGAVQADLSFARDYLAESDSDEAQKAFTEFSEEQTEALETKITEQREKVEAEEDADERAELQEELTELEDRLSTLPTRLAEFQARLEETRDSMSEDDIIPRVAVNSLTDEQQTVLAASIEGDRQTLRADSAIPTAMAAIYLLLFLYFKSIGGYRPLTIGKDGEDKPVEPPRNPPGEPPPPA